PARQAEEPLELHSFEASPYCRLARETLCELELSYRLRNLGKGSAVDFLPPGVRRRVAPDAPHSTEKRRALAARAGKVMVPYLLDPTTGVEMFESAAIVRSLHDTYAL